MSQILWWDGLFDKSASDLYFLVTKQKNKRQHQIRSKTTMKKPICQAENEIFWGRIGKKSGRFLWKEGFRRYFEDELAVNSRGFAVLYF